MVWLSYILRDAMFFVKVTDWKLSWEESPSYVLCNIVLNKIAEDCVPVYMLCVWFLTFYYYCKNEVCVYADTSVFKRDSNAYAALTSKVMLLPV